MPGTDNGFQFVTDILGASHLGLPISKTHYIEADPEELLALGDEKYFSTEGWRL